MDTPRRPYPWGSYPIAPVSTHTPSRLTITRDGRAEWDTSPPLALATRSRVEQMARDFTRERLAGGGGSFIVTTDGALRWEAPPQARFAPSMSVPSPAPTPDPGDEGHYVMVPEAEVSTTARAVADLAIRFTLTKYGLPPDDARVEWFRRASPGEQGFLTREAIRGKCHHDAATGQITISIFVTQPPEKVADSALHEAFHLCQYRFNPLGMHGDVETQRQAEKEANHFSRTQLSALRWFFMSLNGAERRV
jgi:hypothetical protein